MAYSKPLVLGSWALCTGIAGYARFGLGYNILWFVGAYVPMWTVLLYTAVKQPSPLL